MEYHFFSSAGSLFSLILFVFFARKMIKKRSKNLPPGPLKLPIIGNLHNLIGSSMPHHRLSQLAKKYGPVMHLQLGELSAVVISAPQTAEIVLKTHDAIFAKRPYTLVTDIISYESTNIAFSHGSYWRQLRKICTTELLSPKRVRSFRTIREEEVGKLVKSISTRAGSPFNLSRKIFSLTYGITARAALGGICKEQEEFIASVEENVKVIAGFGLADVFPSVKLLHIVSGQKGRVEKTHRESDVILENIINEHKARRKASPEVVKDREDDLVDVLLNLQEHGDLEFPLTTNNIKAVIKDVFSGGSETSSTTVEWAMSEMIKNPMIMEKAQKEVRKVFGAKGIVDEAGLEELMFLKCIIKETLRFHPPGPFLLARECQEECKINGYDIPSKTKVIVNVWAIGRDPEYWTEPDKFYPERFLDNSIDFKGNDFGFVPFGAGRRICPGISFAIHNVELPLANLLYHFDWKLASGVKNVDLDMTEEFALSIRRMKDLCLIAIPYLP